MRTRCKNDALHSRLYDVDHDSNTVHRAINKFIERHSVPHSVCTMAKSLGPTVMMDVSLYITRGLSNLHDVLTAAVSLANNALQ